MSIVPETRWLGTESQVEWAQRIKPRVRAEFERVAKTLEAVARKQSIPDRLDTQAMIAILEEKRVAVLARNEAGYFIKHWQEVTDQVQRLIRDDSRFAAIRLAKAERSNTSQAVTHSPAMEQKKDIYP